MNVSIIGGDLRIAYLAKLWYDEGINVYTYGLEKAEILNNSSIKKCENLEKCVESSNIIVSSIPFSKDNNLVNASFNKNNIELAAFAKCLSNKTFFAGKISEEFCKLAKNSNIIDLMKNEELAILNSISTAEGAIKIAIEETNITIHGSNVLILGFGRIGKVLAKSLSAMGANVFCEARKKQDLAWIETYGYEKVPLEDLNKNIEKYDIIFNTIPHIILNEEKLKLLKKDALIIDLASEPGGVERNICESLEIKNIWALALPGKIAPKSAAKIIKQVIEDEEHFKNQKK